jgi:hypothetical protein
LQIVVFLDPAFQAKFREPGHHLPHGTPCPFSGFAERSLSLFESLHGEHGPASPLQVPHRFGEVTALFFADLGEELIVATLIMKG